MTQQQTIQLLANCNSLSLVESDDSLIEEACLALQAVVRPDLDPNEMLHLSALLSRRAYLDAANILVPLEWSYIVTRHNGGQTEAIVRVSPAIEVSSSISDRSGLALLSALAKSVLSSPKETSN